MLNNTTLKMWLQTSQAQSKLEASFLDEQYVNKVCISFVHFTDMSTYLLVLICLNGKIRKLINDQGVYHD